jgi:hypothetical protein
MEVGEMIDVDIDEVRKLKARLREINSIPFEEIRWMHNGQPVVSEQKSIDGWVLYGFNNADFVRYVVDTEKVTMP